MYHIIPDSGTMLKKALCGRKEQIRFNHTISEHTPETHIFTLKVDFCSKSKIYIPVKTEYSSVLHSLEVLMK